MAPRKSARAVAAREKARANAAKFAERENRLQELAKDFLIEHSGVLEVDEWEAEQVEKIRAKAEADRVAAEQRAAVIVAKLADENVAAREIAERLDVTAAEVKRLRAVAAHHQSSSQAAARSEQSGGLGVDAEH